MECKTEKIPEADTTLRNKSEHGVSSKLLSTLNCKLFSQKAIF